MTELPHTVFVYGTLKKGEPNENVMTNPDTGKYQFVTSAQMIDKYPLIVASKFNIPFLLNNKGHGYRIFGEIYKVDDDKLVALDKLEGYPEFYIREIHDFEAPDGTKISAWIYILREYDIRLDATKTGIIERYSDGIDGRFYQRHENCEKNDDLF